MPYDFDIENISTPTSFAPSAAEEALGRATVEHEVAVREVVHDRAAVALGPGDGRGEDAVRCGDRARVRRVVEVRGARRAGTLEVRRPVRRRQRQRAELGARERDARTCSPDSRVGQQDALAALGEHQAELDERGLRPRDDRDLGRRVEVDAVDVAIPRAATASFSSGIPRNSG